MNTEEIRKQIIREYGRDNTDWDRLEGLVTELGDAINDKVNPEETLLSELFGDYSYKDGGKLLGYELPFTFTADESNLTIITDYLTFYEDRNGMSFDELVAGGYVREDLRYITERYTYTLSDNSLRITDIAYSQISGSDIASLTLTKVE